MRRHTGAQEETLQVPELEKKHLRKSLAKQPKPKHFFPLEHPTLLGWNRWEQATPIR